MFRATTLSCRALARRLSTPAAAAQQQQSKRLLSEAHSRLSRARSRVTQTASACGSSFSATATPIYQTATFGDIHRTPSDGQPAYDYTRSGNPTRHTLEQTLAMVEGAGYASTFTSGMAALTAVIRSLLRPGDRVVASSDLYGGLHRLLSLAKRQMGILVDYVDLSDPHAMEAALSSQAELVLAESPSNPMMRVTDLRLLAELSHKAGAKLCVDNSIMTPLLSQPLQLGADIVVHSATKFIAGHADVMAGAVLSSDPTIAHAIAFSQNSEGNGLAPHDAFLVLRGLKTLDVRLEAAQANAMAIASFLSQHELVDQVLFHQPDGDSDQTRLHFSQARGCGTVLSFVPRNNNPKFAARLLDTSGLKKAVSFGSVHTTMEMPCLHSHASIPDGERHLPEALVRISCGIEDPLDIMEDLSQALHAAYVGEEPLVSLCTHQLGSPLPPSEPDHACGASLPKWADVVGYEEADPRVHAALTCGYPRFVYPPHVRQLIAELKNVYCGPDETAIPAPSARVALRLQQFVAQASAQAAPTNGGPEGGAAQRVSSGACMPRVVDVGIDGLHAVVFPEHAASHAKAYWQHTGELVSSRLANHALDVLGQRSDGRFADDLAQVSSAAPLLRARQQQGRQLLCRRIGDLVGESAENVFLFQSGMGAISACNRLVQNAFADRVAAGGKFVVVGFPYLDSLKQLQHPQLSPGCHYLAATELDKLEALCGNPNEPILGVMIECPSNPLLQTADYDRLHQLSREHNFLLIVDDSIGGFANIDVIGKHKGADVLVSSLTKAFSGRANVMGGAMTLNAASPHFPRLSHYARAQHEDLLFHADAEALLNNSADYLQRSRTYSTNAEHLADYLQTHPAVKRVYYPKFENPDNYTKVARLQQNDDDEPAVAWGGLLSFVLHDESKSEAFYDALDVCKGPGFGTNFTLVCPYTMLAHYRELPFAESQGVSASLLRVWAGVEDKEDIVAAFERAFAALDLSDRDSHQVDGSACA